MRETLHCGIMSWKFMVWKNDTMFNGSEGGAKEVPRRKVAKGGEHRMLVELFKLLNTEWIRKLYVLDCGGKNLYFKVSTSVQVTVCHW